MRLLAGLLLVAHLLFLLAAALLAGTSIAGFTGEAPMIISAALAIALWGTYAGLTCYALTLVKAVLGGRSEKLGACLRWSNGLFLTVAVVATVTGLGLAFGAFASCGPLWLPALYHWLGLAVSVLGFAAFFGLPLVARACGQQGPQATPHRWWVPLVTGLGVYGTWGATWLIAYLILSGSIDESTYPDRASSPFRLPYPQGESSWVIQGNNSSLNHNGAEQHAWDFRRSCGTAVVAARGGTVTEVIDTNEGHGSNNRIDIDHGDGTIGRYLHVQKGSAVVRKGAAARQGETLAEAGNVGNSLTGHIHFVVLRGGRSIPVTFADVSRDKGIPRTFSSYTSGNRRP